MHLVGMQDDDSSWGAAAPPPAIAEGLNPFECHAECVCVVTMWTAQITEQRRRPMVSINMILFNQLAAR